ncbi:MAG: hypothetical protein Q9167_004871 [Letrouitia subvulpina]
MPLQPAISAPLSKWFSAPPPRGSLTLLTSVLGASAHWLVLRHIFAALQRSSPSPSEGEKRDKGAAVVLVSWLSGRQAWVEGFRKLVCHPRLTSSRLVSFRFRFQTLSLPFLSTTKPKKVGLVCWDFSDFSGRKGIDASKITVVDGLQGGIPSPTTKKGKGGLEELEREIERAIAAAAPSPAAAERVVLVLEGLDFLVAATEGGVGQRVEDWALGMVLGLRERVHATVVSLAADLPLMQAQTTPLEIRHAAFVMGIMYQAGVVMSVRDLDTGVARDVSGVLHVCQGPAARGEEEEAEGGREHVEGKEVLYYVARDGGVKILE